MREKYLTPLKESIVNLDFNAVVEVAKEAMDAGVDPHIAITDGMVPGMTIVGEKFESGEYFLSELVVAGEVMKEGLKVINPYIKGDSAKRLGKVVIATVEGDFHDLGKNIVTVLLGVHGFEVVDLGKDVPTDKIINAVKECKPDILGLSALITVTTPKTDDEGNAIADLTITVAATTGDVVRKFFPNDYANGDGDLEFTTDEGTAITCAVFQR